MKTSESSFCFRMCPPGTLRNSRALGYLDWSRLLSQIYENENGEFQIEARFQSKYIVSMRITTMLISSLSQHFDLCNLDQIGLVTLSSTFQSWVMEMFSHSISTSLSYYFLSENDARNLPAAWFGQNFVQQTRLRTTIDINMISSTTPACQRDSYYTGVQNLKKGWDTHLIYTCITLHNHTLYKQC